MKVKAQGKIEDGQVIIAPSFGAGKGSYPGFSNIMIARVVQEIFLKKEVPIIAQVEVANALSKILVNEVGEVKILGEKLVGVIRKHRVKGKYLDTFEVLSQAYEIMKREGWNRAILVAHPIHIPRCKRILEKMGVEVIIPEGLERIPFDPFSTQWWTRNAFLWTVREIPIRLIYKKKGWIGWI